MKLTKREKKALIIVLCAGYASGKENSEDVTDIFIKNYPDIGFTLGSDYSKALEKLGLDDFFRNNQKYIKKGRIE